MTNDQRWEFYLAGVKFHEAHKVLGELGVGVTLSMEPDPTNKYDSSAVKIEYLVGNGVEDEAGNEDFDVTMLGFVPAKISSQVSAFLEINESPVCTITELNPTEKPWKQIKVAIEEGGLDAVEDEPDNMASHPHYDAGDN